MPVHSTAVSLQNGGRQEKWLPDNWTNHQPLLLQRSGINPRIWNKFFCINDNCQKGASSSQQPHYSLWTDPVLALLNEIDPFLLTNFLELKPAKSGQSDDCCFRFRYNAMNVSIFYYFSSTLNKKMIEKLIQNRTVMQSAYLNSFQSDFPIIIRILL